MKVEEFINLKQENMSVDEYSLKFTMFSMYDPSFVSSPREEMSRLTSFANLVKKEYIKAMLHCDMNLSGIMVYAQSIPESKCSRISRNFKRSGPIDQN